MNLLECYIEEIISEEPCPTPKWDDLNRQWVKVKYIYSCYGHNSISLDIYTVEEWEEIKKKGYCMK